MFKNIKSKSLLIFRKIFNKSVSGILAVSIIAVLYSGMVTMVYSVKYQGNEIAQISSDKNPGKEIINLDNRINSVVADGYIPVKNNIEVTEKFIFGSDTDNNTIQTESVIEADKNLNMGYGLKIGESYIIWDKDKSILEEYLSGFEDYANTNYPDSKTDVLSVYQIEPCIYTDSNLKDYKDLMTDLNLTLEKTIYKEIETEREPECIYIYGTEEKQLRQGTNTLIKETYEVKVVNDSETGSAKISEEVISEGKSSIFATPDTNKLTYKQGTVPLSSYQTNFINTILPTLLDGQEKYHIPVSLGLAQAIHESGWGIHHSNNNIYGIKGGSGYKSYNSFVESAEDYINLIATKKNYSKVLTAANYIEACEYIGQSGYAGNPSYGESIKNTVEKYQLYIWDNL